MSGGIPPQRPDQAIEPPTMVISPGGAAGVFKGRLVVIFGTGTNGSTGLFVYSPTPAAGNLIASIAAAAGTDPYGNAYLKGITDYGASGGTQLALQMTNAGIIYYSAATQAGPYTSGASEVFSPTNDLTVSANENIVLIGGAGLGFQTRLSLNSTQIPTAMSGVDGQTYNVGHKTVLATATPQTINSLTPIAITGMTAVLGVGTYRIHGHVRGLQGGTSANQALQLVATGGLVCSTVMVESISGNTATIAANLGVFQLTNALAQNMTSGTMTNGFTWDWLIDGLLVVSTGGTLGLSGLCVTAAADTWTVQAGTYLQIEPVA